MSDRLHELAIAALDDPDAAVVLGDYVLETGWFDRRVMRVIWPFWYSRQGTTPKPKGKTRRSLVKERRGIERRAWTAGYPDEFWSRAAAPTEEWARAVWTVLFFAAWPAAFVDGASKWGFWPVTDRCWVPERTAQSWGRATAFYEWVDQNGLARRHMMHGLDAAIDRDTQAETAHMLRRLQAASGSSGSEPR